MGNKLNLEGQRFGRLLVISETAERKQKSVVWLCKCDCGNEPLVAAKNLREGNTRSCGCINNPFPKRAAALKALFANYKRSAKKRGLAFELSITEFHEMTRHDCFYCGVSPDQIYKCRDRRKQVVYDEYIYNGIDRIDSTKGYTQDNVVTACGHCNMAKNSMTTSEFKAWLERVYQHFIGVS